MHTHRFDAKTRLAAAIVALGAFAGCGGTTIDGTRSVPIDGAGGSAAEAGGASGFGAGGSSGAGGFAGSPSGSGGGPWLGAGGAVVCPPVVCAQGYESTPGPDGCPQCTPVCFCPALPACPPGQQYVTLPGQCCPTCVPTELPDSGPPPPACRIAPVDCTGNTWAKCPPNWSAALATYSTCDPPTPGGGAHLAECGSYHAVVVWGIDTSTTFFYDAGGMLVGRVDGGMVQNSGCTAYDPTFVPPSAECKWFPNCPGAVDAGPPTCGNGVIDGQDQCDGANLNGLTCASATMGSRPNGMLRCTASCSLDVSGCY